MSLQGVLVSVRDAGEAEEALAGGARVIDVKDPARGSLGAAAPEAIARVAAAIGDRVPWTMAAGELAVGCAPLAAWMEAVVERLPPSAARPAAVKAGLAGMADRPWRDALAGFHALVPGGCLHVAVAYADFDRVQAPPPAEVIAAAADIGCGMLLIDTADKRGPGLLGLWSVAEVAGWVEAAHGHGLGVAIAGRLSLADILRARACAAEVLALRSAVCSNAEVGDVRLGRVSSALVEAAVAASIPARLAPLARQTP